MPTTPNTLHRVSPREFPVAVGRWGACAALIAVACASASATALAQDAATAPVRAKHDRYLFKIASTESAAPAAPPAGDAASPAVDAGFTGRLILFFLPDTPRWEGVDPASAPFATGPTPIASIPVRGVAEGGEIRIESDRLDGATDARAVLEELDGAWRMQAVLDIDFTERGHLGPGNLVSEPVRVELARDHADEVTATLSRRIPPPATTESADADAAASPVQWLTRPSKQLGAALHRTTDMRVGVVLPYGYDDLSFPRRMWPTIYVLGDFGASHRDAMFAAAALRDPNARAAVPQAVWVFLEPTTPWGASGFCDSDANGPVARALVDELIPALEERFRLIPQANARVLLGHGFGGWAAIHLALAAPTVFGSCYASAPDFVDFSALGTVDLYRDPSLFVARDGGEAPALRSILGPSDDLLRYTTREQIATERAIDPDGRSGERWAARDAMWSPWQPERNAPRAICDARTGEIDLIAAESWSRVDIAKRLERQPAAVGPLLASRVHILCGARDSFYRNEAVARLKAKLDAWRAREAAAGRTPSDRGSIELIDDVDDDALRQLAVLRFHRAIAAELRAAGHAEDQRLDTESRARRPSGSARPKPEPPRGG